MISLRKHIDNYATVETASEEPALAAFRSALLAIGESGQRAVPFLAEGLNRTVADINRGLEPDGAPESLNKAARRIRTELGEWAESAQRHHNKNEAEMKQIMGAVMEATQAIGVRDEKYGSEIGALAHTMRFASELKDIAAIRASILDSTILLQSRVQEMVQEGKAATTRLNAELDDYRQRLAQSETAAAIDPLTRLGNRRAFEKRLQQKVSSQETFSLLLIDLNDFKTVNDRHGHLAGDDLLRQFAAELSDQLRPPDLVCRWGGDEFAVIVAGNEKQAKDRAHRVTRWVLGEYKISNGATTVKTLVKASTGVVEWDGTESGVELLSRADQALYRQKPRRVAV